MHFVYVLRNSKGILYKGQTNDLNKRLNQHNDPDGFSSFTKSRGPWKLVYQETCKTRKEAKAREAFLKSGIGREFLEQQLESMIEES